MYSTHSVQRFQIEQIRFHTLIGYAAMESSASVTPELGLACQQTFPENGGNAIFLQTLVLTVVVTCAFFLSKNTYDRVRRQRARATIYIIGAGPIGLTSVLIAVRSKRASKIIIMEERSRKELLNRQQQIAIDHKNVTFLNSLGVDFDNIEGCWQNRSFFTRLGVIQEYLLSIVERLDDIPLEIRLNTKFNRETLKEVENQSGRVVAIACDGSTGRAATLLGLSDEFIHQSCKAYGACAAIERYHQRSVPTAETRAHNLTFDLGAYGNNGDEDNTSLPPHGFHLKLFGSVRHRYMALAVPKCESKVVKTLKMALYQSLMRNVFQVCFNRYKTECEPDISDMESISKLKFSPRLFEIKLAQRMENVGYIQESNLFVVTEGEAARCLNFHSGNISESVDLVIECWRVGAACHSADVGMQVKNTKRRGFQQWPSVEKTSLKRWQRLEIGAALNEKIMQTKQGFGVNIALRGLYSLQHFLSQAVAAETENAILQTLLHKNKQARAVAHEFIKNGMRETMYT